MRWVYISPHFDDVVLSCGGIVWEQAQAGEQVEIWTICAGGVPAGVPLSPFAQSLHARWETGPEAVLVRQKEDEAAASRLGATVRYWDLPDCVYRQLPPAKPGEPRPWLVNGEDDLWQPVHPGEMVHVERLCAWLAENLRAGDQMAGPMTLGNHVDHNLVRKAVECAARRPGVQLWYYQDYPYAIRPSTDWTDKIDPAWEKACQPVSRDGLRAWQDAVQCYASQASTFWSGLDEMRDAIEAYWQSENGPCLWKAK